MTAYAVLLRGVNVGGRSLPMATLRAALTDLGYDDVRTYLQSGNAVFDTTASAGRVSEAVQRILKERTGLDIVVVTRSASDLARVVDRWPFDPAAAPTTRHVTFLRSSADAAPLRSLPVDGLQPDRFVIAGAHVYLSLPNGLGRSKLAALVSRRLDGVVATTRNWNTVTALRALSSALR